MPRPRLPFMNDSLSIGNGGCTNTYHGLGVRPNNLPFTGITGGSLTVAMTDRAGRNRHKHIADHHSTRERSTNYE